jgi:RNA polymerase sigma factor (sigma-70 family)
MVGENHGAVARGIERIFNQGSLTGLSEGQLLVRFAAGDGGAFEAIVTRHGPTVLGVCRRILFDASDVEDAFQATFLVLLKKAGGLRDAEALGPWLHGVAYRVAARIRAGAARRPAEESKGARPEAVESACEPERTELKALLDEEIARLPETYRRPVVLCYLEGRSHEDAARRLHCSTGSLRGRLDRARKTLQVRLVRRGVAPAAGLAALAAGGEAASAAIPAPLAAATVATLARAATATAISATPPAAMELADAVFRGMGLARLRVATLLVVGFLALGAWPLVAALERASSPPRAAATRADGITLKGRVLDREGRPIAGARVALGSDLREKESVPEAATDADGRFTLPGVPAGPAVLTVQARGHEPDLKTLTAGPSSPPVEFRLGPGHTISLRIVDVHRKPIAGAPIAADQWRGHHSLRWKTRTDAEGRFRWDDAPADGVLIDLGRLGYSAKRFWTMKPGEPEGTMTMRRPLRVRGRVTDVDTGRPITAFTLVPGYSHESTQTMWWENGLAKAITGLSYDVTLSTEQDDRVIRIDAEGYTPAVSRVLKDDEEEAVVHFALRRGSGVTGVVHLPDGSPLAGAEVMLGTQAHPVFLNEGRPSAYIGNQWVTRTYKDGRFQLPPQEPRYSLVVLHDRGYALHHAADKPAVAPDLTIRPWSRVEGTLRIGRRPGSGRQLMLSRGQRPFLPPDIHWSDGATTDAEGRFAFERVVPGEVLISRLIPFGGIASAGGSPSARLDVAPGATTRLTLGGTGRPVVGKAVVPAGFAGRDDWRFGFCYLTRKPTTEQEQIPAPFRRPAESYVFKVEPDGSFRIDDIGAGDYEIQIIVNERPAEGGGLIGHEPLASVRRDVVVPAMPGGRSDEPLNLGAIPLEAVGKAEPAPKP